MFDFLKTLKRNYKTGPLLIRWLLFPCFWSYHFARKFYGMIRPSVWLLNGAANKDKEPVCLMYCGDVLDKNYLIRMMFAGECTQADLGRFWFWQVNKFIKNHKPEVDILMYDVPQCFCALPGKRRCFCLPSWVEGDLDFSLIDFNGRSLKNDIKRILKNAFTFEVTRDMDKLKYFYNEIYVPYAKERHGDELVVEDFEDWVKVPENAEVLFVKDDKVYVAGGGYYYENGNIILNFAGVNPIDGKLLNSGGIQAIYYFLFLHLKDKGIKRIFLGGVRPFFRDGLLVFKKKWGFRFTHCLPEKNMIRVYLLRDNPGVKDFLISNPCIAMEGKELVGMVFNAKEGELTKDEADEYAGYLWPGLKKVVLYRFGDSGSGENKSTLDLRFIVRPAKLLFNNQ